MWKVFDFFFVQIYFEPFDISSLCPSSWRGVSLGNFYIIFAKKKNTNFIEIWSLDAKKNNKKMEVK